MAQASEKKSVKKLRSIQRSVDQHWVGNGFPVRTLFSYPALGPVLSPFLLLDYAGPREFPPTQDRLGVGEHPHRGFETVTIVYDGEVEHRDSSGGGGRIGPGDVQWMTAASGIVHEEFHGRDFAVETAKGRVTYLFTVPVAPPAVPSGTIAINVDDPTWYTAFALVEPVRVQAPGAYEVACRLARDEQTKRPEGIKCSYRRRAP